MEKNNKLSPSMSTLTKAFSFKHASNLFLKNAFLSVEFLLLHIIQLVQRFCMCNRNMPCQSCLYCRVIIWTVGILSIVYNVENGRVFQYLGNVLRKGLRAVHYIRNFLNLGSMDGTGWAFASHQCGPGSIPRLGINVGWVCCWFSPLLREVFLQVLWFSPLLKNQHFQIPIQSGIRGPPSLNKDLFILTFYYTLVLTAQDSILLQ